MNDKVTARVLMMTSKKGFTTLFWREVRRLRGRTHEEVYELMEQEYMAVFGRRRYASFASFRRRRDDGR